MDSVLSNKLEWPIIVVFNNFRLIRVRVVVITPFVSAALRRQVVVP